MRILTVGRDGVVVHMTEREYRIAFEAIRSQELLDREEADAQEAGRTEVVAEEVKVLTYAEWQAVVAQRGEGAGGGLYLLEQVTPEDILVLGLYETIPLAWERVRQVVEERNTPAKFREFHAARMTLNAPQVYRKEDFHYYEEGAA